MVVCCCLLCVCVCVCVWVWVCVCPPECLCACVRTDIRRQLQACIELHVAKPEWDEDMVDALALPEAKVRRHVHAVPCSLSGASPSPQSARVI